jgi:hypothetical protein
MEQASAKQPCLWVPLLEELPPSEHSGNLTALLVAKLDLAVLVLGK